MGRRFASVTDGRTYERWESPDLALLISATHTDEQTGIIEYRLTNVRRDEPPPDLFVLPLDQPVVKADECWISLVRAETPQWKNGGLKCDD